MMEGTCLLSHDKRHAPFVMRLRHMTGFPLVSVACYGEDLQTHLARREAPGPAAWPRTCVVLKTN